MIKIAILPVLVFFLFSCAITQKKSKKLLVSAEKQQFDAVIVPGVPFDGDNWQMTMQIRVHWSKYLFDKGITKNVIYSGGAVYSGFNEAKVMAIYAEALGIPKNQIFVDTLAEHSTENLYYSHRVARSHGFKNIALASDPFQSGTLKSFIKKHKLPINLVPIVFDTLAQLDKYEPKIDPSSAFDSNFVSIKERESFFKRFRGTLGKQIIWKSSELPNEKLRRKYRRKNRCID